MRAAAARRMSNKYDGGFRGTLECFLHAEYAATSTAADHATWAFAKLRKNFFNGLLGLGEITL